MRTAHGCEALDMIDHLVDLYGDAFAGVLTAPRQLSPISAR
jgi:hypothetical protein